MSSPSVGGLVTNDGGRVDRTPIVAGRFDGDHVLVPLLTSDVPTLIGQLETATALARAADSSLTVIDPMALPDRGPELFYHRELDDGDSALLGWVCERATGTFPRIDSDFVCTRSVVQGVLRTVRRRDVDTLVVSGSSPVTRLRRGVAERIAAHTAVDVVVVGGRAGRRETASILLPVAGGPHSGLAADVASSVAVDRDAWIDVLHVIEGDAPDRRRERADELVERISERIGRPETTSTWVLEAPDVTEAIVEQSRYYGLTVVGAPTRGRLRRFVSGSTSGAVRENADSVVLSARNNSATSDDG